jgi:uncharacterized protein
VLARALALALLWTAVAAAEVAVPPLSARVTDLTNTLDAGQRAALEARLSAFERAKGSQVVVLIVPTTQPETIEQYGIRVAEAWKIGRGGDIDDGVILLVAKDDRKLRLEIGYGLEGAVPDAVSKRIIDEVIVPAFRAGDFYGGIHSGVERIIGVIEGEPLPPPSQRSPGSGALPSQRSVGGGVPDESLLWMIIPVPLLVGGMVRMLHNRYSGGAAAGVLAGGLGWWLTGAALVALAAALICSFFILAAGRSGRSRGWSSGGGWGGFGGGYSGGGGGFSGGGGGFGGGGASGSW